MENHAPYGNPQGSSPYSFKVLETGNLTRTLARAEGVTGQQMSTPLVIGKFDVLGQMIVTDNSTVVALQVPDGLSASGSLEVISQQGLA